MVNDLGLRLRTAQWRWLSALAVGALGFASSCALDVPPFPESELQGRVGLDIDIINGSSRDLTLLPGHSFYINQLRFQVNQKEFPAPDVREWLQAESEMSVLDWAGTARVKTDWHDEGGSFQELRPYMHAVWMSETPEFRLEFYDGDGNAVVDAFELSGDDFVISRQTAIVWIDGEPAKGDYGTNSTSYPEVEITTAGDFAGPDNDVYGIEVTTAGPMDGTATIDITSARGDSQEDVAVQSGVPIVIGTAGGGGSITFTDNGVTPTDHALHGCRDGRPVRGNARQPGDVLRARGNPPAVPGVRRRAGLRSAGKHPGAPSVLVRQARRAVRYPGRVRIRRLGTAAHGLRPRRAGHAQPPGKRRVLRAGRVLRHDGRSLRRCGQSTARAG
jgi:hypothetical protein